RPGHANGEIDGHHLLPGRDPSKHPHLTGAWQGGRVEPLRHKGTKGRADGFYKEPRRRASNEPARPRITSATAPPINGHGAPPEPDGRSSGGRASTGPSSTAAGVATTRARGAGVATLAGNDGGVGVGAGVGGGVGSGVGGGVGSGVGGGVGAGVGGGRVGGG